LIIQFFILSILLVILIFPIYEFIQTLSI